MSSLQIENPFADAIDLAPTVIKANQTWVDMLEAFASMMDSNVESPISQLERIRSIHENADPRVLFETARILGFDLSQDVLNLNSENFIRLVSQLPLYPDQNGTEVFIKFMDLALNAQTRLYNQYTRDYVNFYDSPAGALIVDGGPWFKTTHVRLDLDIRNVEQLTLASGQSLLEKTRELFFIFAPIHLVIEKYAFVVELEPIDFGLGAVVGLVEMTVTLM